jgi:hypothetical protein
MNEGAAPGVSDSSSHGDQLVDPDELMSGWTAAIGMPPPAPPTPADAVYPPHPGGGGDTGGGGLCQSATIPWRMGGRRAESVIIEPVAARTSH